MKKICIIGYGAIAASHAKALVSAQNAEFYAVCDINPERIAICQKDYDVIGYTDYRDVLKDTNIDGVHICTPHYLHYEMVSAALKAGKTVICEKPVTLTRAQFDDLMQLPQKDNLGLVFQNRLKPCVLALKNLIDGGSLGKVTNCKAILTWSRGKEYYASGSWRGKWDTEGGGVLINQAIHTLDLLCYLVGEVKALSATMTNFSLQDVIEVEDTFNAYLQYTEGATAIFFATNAYGKSGAIDFEFIFENGIAKYTDSKLYINGECVCEDTVATGEKAYWGTTHGELICNFYDRGVYFKLEDVKNTMYTIFAMYESAKQNGKSMKTF